MDFENFTYNGLIYSKQFNELKGVNYTNNRYKTIQGDLFDFGYVLTVHKAQGSQAERVILLEERSPYMDQENWNRWLYTGITRAQRELFIFAK
jgi:ATP-dependent exoDNAse (exonuclease V) alpha subunit